MGEADSPTTSHSILSEPSGKVATLVLKCVVMKVSNPEL
jgi:hypothetical protein